MKKNTFLCIVLTLFFSAVNGQGLYEFETAMDNGDNVTETVDGVLLTVTGSPEMRIQDLGGLFGSSGNIVNSFDVVPSVTFTFDQAVDVTSILVIEGNGQASDYTFTPTGGDNTAVVAAIAAAGGTSVDLNWAGVTSFTVTTSLVAGATFAFDNLQTSPNSLSVDDVTIDQSILIYPNPVERILYIKNVSGLKSVNVYSNVGQLVLQSKKASIDLSQLSQGMYLLRITSDHGIETKRIIKQ